jgi:hypothetical protein
MKVFPTATPWKIRPVHRLNQAIVVIEDANGTPILQTSGLHDDPLGIACLVVAAMNGCMLTNKLLLVDRTQFKIQ